MPVISDRQRLSELAVLISATGLIWPELQLLSDEDVLIFLGLLDSCRYLTPRIHNIPKSSHWLHYVLADEDFDDGRFRTQLRMARESFNYVVSLLKDAPSFQNTSEVIPIQIAVALYNFGTFGNGSSIRNVATKFGICEGSVENFTTRTIEALHYISQNWIKWPDATERNRIGNQMAQNFLPRCVGFIDGSEATLDTAPSDDKETYWSRKKKYSIQFQIACDPNQLIRSFYIGYPGSVHDAKVFSMCDLSRHPENFFSNGEFLIGDSAYPKSETQVVPYKRYAPLTKNQKTFNRHISKYRVRVEQSIGKLKGRFQSLQGLRIKVDKVKGHKKACLWVEACVVLHNILTSMDPWNNPTDDVHQEPEEEEPLNETDNFVPSPFPDAAEMKRGVLSQIVNAMY